MLKLIYLYESEFSKHMFKCLHLNANILPIYSDIHNYYNRIKNKLIATKCNTKNQKSAYLRYAVSLCNVLPTIGQYPRYAVIGQYLHYAVSLCNVLPTIGQYLRYAVSLHFQQLDNISTMLYHCVMCYQQ